MFRSLAGAWGRSIGRKAARDYLQSDDFKKSVQGVIAAELAKPEYAWFRFVKHMQARMMEVDKSLDGKRAFQLAAQTYREFLKDEKIEFGDPRFDWSRDGARDLIQAYEIDHWERAV